MNDQSQGPSVPIVDLMEQGVTVMRAENENLQAMAIQRPRDVAKLAKSAIEELRAFPQFAAKMYYSIPYKDRSSGQEKEVFVEGPSIKAANALARAWGNNTSGFRVVGTDEERVLIQGIFLDQETGMRRTSEISVSRKARKRDGSYYLLPPDRLNMAIQAGGSKAVRNAILNALPIGLVESYFQDAKRLAARGGKVEVVENKETDNANIVAEIKKSLESLEKRGVERAEVEAYLSRNPQFETEEQVSAHLVGLLTAIEDGAITVEAAFSVSDTPIAEPQRTVLNNQDHRPDGVKSLPTTPKPDVRPGAQKPAERNLPEDRRRMQAKLEGSICKVCHKSIKKGDWIYKNAAGLWVHEETC